MSFKKMQSIDEYVKIAGEGVECKSILFKRDNT